MRYVRFDVPEGYLYRRQKRIQSGAEEWRDCTPQCFCPFTSKHSIYTYNLTILHRTILIIFIMSLFVTQTAFLSKVLR